MELYRYLFFDYSSDRFKLAGMDLVQAFRHFY